MRSHPQPHGRDPLPHRQQQGINSHPFALQNGSDEYLLRQESDQAGSLESNSGIEYQEDDEGITFTYTQDMADAVNKYICTFHSSMEGSVQTSN